jgi:beta-glucosidase
MSNLINRREFVVAGTAVLAATASPAVTSTESRAQARTKPSRRAALEFPKGFYWGVATSAYQIKGAANEDGKGKSIWDTYAHTPGKIKDGSTGDVANDHYHLYTEGVALMRSIGAKAYRFSIAMKLPPAELNQVRHHAVLTHGLSVQAIRAKGKKGTKCGPAENINIAVPLIESPEHIKAAEAATRELNASFLTVMLERKYTDAYLKAAGKDAPQFTDDDLKVIGTPVDFVGINVYRPTMDVLASEQNPGYREVPFNASHPKMFSSWHVLGPEVLYWAPKFAQSLWKAKEIHITENGCAADDKLADDGNVYDTDRVMFLRNNLTQLQRATAAGVPVKGYFLWSMMDNFEWTAGFGNRFGVVYVDYKTQQRTPNDECFVLPRGRRAQRGGVVSMGAARYQQYKLTNNYVQNCVTSG